MLCYSMGKSLCKMNWKINLILLRYSRSAWELHYERKPGSRREQTVAAFKITLSEFEPRAETPGDARPVKPGASQGHPRHLTQRMYLSGYVSPVAEPAYGPLNLLL